MKKSEEKSKAMNFSSKDASRQNWEQEKPVVKAETRMTFAEARGVPGHPVLFQLFPSSFPYPLLQLSLPATVSALLLLSSIQRVHPLPPGSTAVHESEILLGHASMILTTAAIYAFSALITWRICSICRRYAQDIKYFNTEYYDVSALLWIEKFARKNKVDEFFIIKYYRIQFENHFHQNTRTGTIFCFFVSHQTSSQHIWLKIWEIWTKMPFIWLISIKIRLLVTAATNSKSNP